MARRRRRSYSGWAPYVPVAERRYRAAKLVARHRADGRQLSPVQAAGGRKIANSFWGAAWCQNLERYSDYSNRLPRGRTYLRNGSVIDLQITPGQVQALVSGSSIYRVTIAIEPLAPARWRRLCEECAGGIDSLVELLAGRFSSGVMAVLSQPGSGMFPEPRQISLSCSCPDWATMCKHVAAVLYGIGARLDISPELLFTLRQVDQTELLAASAGGIEATAQGAGSADLEGEDLGALFGIELAVEPEPKPKAKRKTAPKRKAKAAKPKRKPRQPRKPWIHASELRERGVPNSTVQGWLRRGLLEHSGERGLYVRTAATEKLIRDYLARRSR